MKETMTRATGLGGVFLRAADPEKLHAWYEEHFGIKRTEDGAFAFFSEGRGDDRNCLLPKDTKCFGPDEQQAMFNLRVDELGRGLEKSRRSRPAQSSSQTGRRRLRPLAWFTDLEGNRVELSRKRARMDDTMGPRLRRNHCEQLT